MQPGDYLEEIAIPLIDQVESSGLAGLSRAERVVYLVWCFVANVDNGGFSAFFYNSSGENAHETVAALRAVGHGSIADLLLRGMALFPGGDFPVDSEERNRLWNSLPEEQVAPSVEALDSAFYRIGSEALFQRTWEYWQREGGSPT